MNHQKEHPMNRLNRRSEILNEIVAERIRQDKKWGEQNHPIVLLADDPVLDVDAYRHTADGSRECHDRVH